MHISEETNMDDMGQERTEAKKGISWKLQNYSDPAYPQECIRDYVKETNIPDMSELNDIIGGSEYMQSQEVKTQDCQSNIIPRFSKEAKKEKQLFRHIQRMISSEFIASYVILNIYWLKVL